MRNLTSREIMAIAFLSSSATFGQVGWQRLLHLMAVSLSLYMLIAGLQANKKP